MLLCVAQFYKVTQQERSLFDRYGVDGVMPDANSDDKNDAPSFSGSTQNQGCYGRNDDNLANEIRYHIMFQMYMNYN